jgi:glucokinase
MRPNLALVADIGGTNARFAIADLDRFTLSDVKIFPSRDFKSLPSAAENYVSRLHSIPTLACFATAGPLTGDVIRLTNLGWTCTHAELQAAARVKDLIVINDFEAQALALPFLKEIDLHLIGSPVQSAEGVKAVLGPGTGLGVAGLVRDRESWIPISSEGGHISFAVEDGDELSLLRKVYPEELEHISAERLVSGPGLARLYTALKGTTISREALQPAAIVARARGGADKEAEKAVSLFANWLARFAGDVALIFGARGGVYLAGGIAPNILFALAPERFRPPFEAKGRMSSFLSRIAVSVILAPDTGLRGAAVAAANRFIGWGDR